MSNLFCAAVAKKGPAPASPYSCSLPASLQPFAAPPPYLPEAAAAAAGAFTLTLICFGFASSRLGIVSVSTPL